MPASGGTAGERPGRTLRLMGFLDKVKRAVGGPGAIEIETPASFRWDDGRLPVTVTLTNTTDAPVRVAEVRAKLSSERSKFSRKRTLDDEFTLGPGASEARFLEIPLHLDTSRSTMESAAAGAELPEWVGTAASRTMGPATTPRGKHELSVVVKLADSSRLSNGHATVTAQ